MRVKLLIGLGNPGDAYADTYHNAGWEILEFFKKKLEERYGPAVAKAGKDFRFYQYGPYHLIYPDTYMNLSGEAVKSALSWFGEHPESTVIFHDDSDLAFGEYKTGPLFESGDAGHRGVSSIMGSIGNGGADPVGGSEAAAITRVRIGIRDPLEMSGERPRRKAGDFVLKRMSEAELGIMEVLARELSETFLKD